MAVGALVSVEEYLRSTWRPDRDYVDGEVVERNLGEWDHGRLQGRIMAWLFVHEARLRIRAVVEVRLRITPTRFRIPDVMVVSVDAPRERVVETPPLLCIEILSSRDTPARMWKRAGDYLSIGVPVCWIVDPETSRAWIGTADCLTEVVDGILRAGAIEMPLAEVAE